MSEEKVKKEVKLNLYQKIQKVIEETGFIPKKGRNAIQKYDYVQESDVVNALRGVMAKYGVVVIPTLKETRWLESVPTRSGGSMSKVQVDMSYKFINADNPKEFEEVVVSGEGMDSGDKAINKAITASKKYALLLIFLLPTGDDPEKDEKVDIETTGVKVKKVINPNGILVKDLPAEEKKLILDKFSQFNPERVRLALNGLNIMEITLADARKLYSELRK